MSQRKKITNPLRVSPSPFIKRDVKREQPLRAIPKVKNEHQRTIPANETENWKEYDLKACTAEEIQDIRTHVLKFQSKHNIVPKEFSQPIRLHRKETRNLQYQLTRAEIEQRQKEYAELVALETAQREKRLAAKAEREKNMDPSQKKFDITLDPTVAPEPVKTEEQKLLEKKEKQQQHIAPDGGARKNLNPMKPKKTRQLRALDENAKKLRYEEYYPWVMEDYDGKNTWVGSYEAGNSDQYALLVLGDDNQFKLLPADKVYRFTPRNKYNTLTLAEAEKRMSRNNQTPRWFMKHLDEREQKLTRYERTQRKLKTVVGTQEGDRGERDSDNDDLDFEEDFADDEENPIVDGEEQDVKESERKIKREQRQANAMGLRQYDLLDEDEEEDLFGERKVDKSGKKIRKALVQTGADGLYDSDDDEENPYLSEGDLEIDEDDEEEEYVKKEEEGSKISIPQANRAQSPTVSKIKVKSYSQGYITFKALPSVLRNFPHGTWNPKLKKRKIEQPAEEGHDTKRIKTESPVQGLAAEENIPSIIQIEEGGAAARVDPNLLTEQDLIEIVTREKTTAKQLIHKLKNKLNAHPDNKGLIKTLVKKVLKNQDGFLVLKKAS